MRFSSFVERIGGPSSRAWDLHYQALAAKRRGEDVIVLSVGDPAFETPAAARAAAFRAIEAGDTHYTEIAGRLPLRTLIAADHSLRSGQVVTAENVIVLAGTQNALYCAAACLLSPGDEVIVPEPMYLTYRAALQASGAKIVTVPCPAERQFHIDLKALAAAVTGRTRAIFFATPNNPTGAAATLDELNAIAALAIKHDLWVVSDEVYGRLCFEATHLSIGALPGMAARTVTASSVSKSHAMTGWRIGWMIAPEPLIGHVKNLVLCMLYGLAGFAQEAACEALRSGDAEVDRMRTVYRRRRDEVFAWLSSVAGLRCVRPEAGMFILIDVRGTGLGAAEFAWQLYAATHVAVLDAETFGPSVAGHIRISVTVDDHELELACQRIAQFVAGLAARATGPA
jgi:arginine:pyruvate transaminase